MRVQSVLGVDGEVRRNDAVRVKSQARAAGFVSTESGVTTAVAADPSDVREKARRGGRTARTGGGAWKLLVDPLGVHRRVT